MTEQHDGHECRELLPQRLARITERHRGAEEERNTDRERDQRHHSGQSIAKLAHRAGYERPAAICEHCGAEDRGDPHRARQRGRRVSDQLRQHVSPDQDGDRQRERNPELPTKHRRAVTGMPVVRVVFVHDGARQRGMVAMPIVRMAVENVRADRCRLAGVVQTRVVLMMMHRVLGRSAMTFAHSQARPAPRRCLRARARKTVLPGACGGSDSKAPFACSAT